MGSVVLLQEVGDSLVESIVALLLRKRLMDDVVSGLVQLGVDLLAQVLIVDLVVVLALHICAELLGQLILQVAHRLDSLLGSLQSANQVLLRHLAHLTLNHHQVVLGATNHDIEVGVLHLVECRIDDILAIDASHTALRDGVLKRYGGAGHGSRSCKASERIGLILAVAREQPDLHEYLTVEIRGEQGAQGTVHKA